MLSYWAWPIILLCLYLSSPTKADVETADDVDAGMLYSGLWVPDGAPNTFGHHDTWTNQSGAAVQFNFIGAYFVFPSPTATHIVTVASFPTS